MTEQLNKMVDQGLLDRSRFLTRRGQVHFKELKAGKITSYKLAALTGYTPEYVRQVLNSHMRVTVGNVRILDAIQAEATKYHHK